MGDGEYITSERTQQSSWFCVYDTLSYRSGPTPCTSTRTDERNIEQMSVVFGANLPGSFDTEVLAIVGSRPLRHRAPRFSSASGRCAQSRGRNANKNNASLFSASAWLLNPGHNKGCFRFIVHVLRTYWYIHDHPPPPTPPARMSGESAGESEYRLFGVVLKTQLSVLRKIDVTPPHRNPRCPAPPTRRILTFSSLTVG